jgi:pimeloyl-ACP methyl ester carboxylesterase
MRPTSSGAPIDGAHVAFVPDLERWPLNRPAASTPICFLAGESAERSWRYVIPFLPPAARPIYYELRGRAEPGPDYSWQDEVDGLAETLPLHAEAHLVGLSAGATLALAFVAAHPSRVASLSLIEPAWSYLPLAPIERDYFDELSRILRLPAAEARDGFRRLIVRADVPLPPLRSDLAERERGRQRAGAPSSLLAMTEAMQRHAVDPAAFAAFPGRVFIGIGGRSHPMWQAQADALAMAFPVSRVERFLERHHLDAPQKSETVRVMADLAWAWDWIGEWAGLAWLRDDIPRSVRQLDLRAQSGNLPDRRARLHGSSEGNRA